MPKTIITCAITGAGPHADHVGAPARSPGHHRRAGYRCRRGWRSGDSPAPPGTRPMARPRLTPHISSFSFPAIKQATDAVINISTGGNPVMTVAERIPAAKTFSPEMCSLNMGSMNFALHPLAERYQAWKEDWEEGYIRSSEKQHLPQYLCRHSHDRRRAGRGIATG